MKDMKIGDLAFFYHSNCKVPGIAGNSSAVLFESSFDFGQMYRMYRNRPESLTD